MDTNTKFIVKLAAGVVIILGVLACCVDQKYKTETEHLEVWDAKENKKPAEPEAEKDGYFDDNACHQWRRGVAQEMCRKFKKAYPNFGAQTWYYTCTNCGSMKADNGGDEIVFNPYDGTWYEVKKGHYTDIEDGLLSDWVVFWRKVENDE